MPAPPVRILLPSASFVVVAISSPLFLEEPRGRPSKTLSGSISAPAEAKTSSIATAKSRPDGYTIMIASDPLVINPTIYSNLTYDPVRDFAPIITVATLSQVLAVHPKMEAKNFAEFVALAKAKPNTINIGTSGVGSPGHLAVALLNRAGVPVVHVPYRGAGPAVIDAVGGQIQGTIVTLPATIAMMRQNQLRALAVTSSRRSRFSPDTPTMAEQLPDVVVDSWQAYFAPAGTPGEIVQKLNTEFAALLKTPEVMAAFETQAFEAGGGSPDDLGKFLRDEFTKWTPVIKAAGIRVE